MSSSTDNTRLAKNTLYMYLRMFTTMVVALYTSRVVLQELGEVSYGVYSAVGGIVAIFTFISGAMASSTSRFISFAIGQKNEQRITSIFSTTLFLHVLLSLLILVLGESVGLWYLTTIMRLPSGLGMVLQVVYQCSILNVIFVVLSVPFTSMIVAQERMNVYAYLAIFDVVAKLGVAFLLMGISIDKLGFYAAMQCLISLSVLIIYVLYCFRQKFVSSLSIRYDRAELKEMVGFGSWSLYVNLSTVASSQGVNLILNYVFGVVVNTAYGLAMQIQNAVRSFSLGFQIALNPQITKTLSGGDLERHYFLIVSSMKVSFFLILVVALPIYLNVEELLYFWLGKYPDAIVSFVKWILLTAIVQSIGNPLGVSVEASGKIGRLSFITATLILVSLPVSYLLLNVYQEPAIPFCILFFVQFIVFVYKLYYCHLHSGLDYGRVFRQAIVPILLVLTLAFISCAGIYVWISHSFWGTVLQVIIDLIAIVFWCVLIGLNKSERQWIVNTVLHKLPLRRG